MIAYVAKRHGQTPFTLTGNLKSPFKFILMHFFKKLSCISGKVPAGFPQISPPPFVVEKDNKTIHFSEMVSEIKTGIVFIPLLSIISNVGIAKSFGKAIIFAFLSLN